MTTPAQAMLQGQPKSVVHTVWTHCIHKVNTVNTVSKINLRKMINKVDMRDRDRGSAVEDHLALEGTLSRPFVHPSHRHIRYV